MNIILGLIFVGIGLFTGAGAIFNWDWFIGHPRARFVVGLFGRAGARVIYGLLGLMLISMGVMYVLGLIQTR